MKQIYSTKSVISFNKHGAIFFDPISSEVDLLSEKRLGANDMLL